MYFPRKNDIEALKKKYYNLSRYARVTNKERFFKITSKNSSSINELTLPQNEEEFKVFISNLYIIFYEGSSNNKRIPEYADKREAIGYINKLRNFFYHDIEHGDEKRIEKKYMEIGKLASYTY